MYRAVYRTSLTNTKKHLIAHSLESYRDTKLKFIHRKVQRKLVSTELAPVSYAARKQIDAAIDDLLEKGIITPVRTADFACPIIAVPKPWWASMRICGNFKLTANKMLKVEQYPATNPGGSSTGTWRWRKVLQTRSQPRLSSDWVRPWGPASIPPSILREVYSSTEDYLSG